MTHWIESHFGTVMTLGIFAGLLIPGLEATPSVFVSIFLAVIIYFSCFKLSTQDAKAISVKNSGSFYIARFILVPIILFLLAMKILPDYAPAILLFSLMPAAAGSPGLATLLGGNVTYAFSVLLLSTLLSPFIIPLTFAVLVGESVTVDSGPLFVTLSCVVFVPLVVFLATRRLTKLKTWTDSNGIWVTTVLLSVVAMFAIAASREVLYADPMLILESIVILSVLFTFYYVAGWWLGRSGTFRDKVTLATCSGANNNSLSAGVALLHFPPEIVIFCVASELPWALGVVFFKRWLSSQRNSPKGL
jgi:predicted Na+-dependent transporter